MDAAQRRLNGRLGGLKLAATRDPLEYTSAARATFLASFLEQVPADLPPAERERRAIALRKLHFARLAAKSAASRRRKSPAPIGSRAGLSTEASSNGRRAGTG